MESRMNQRNYRRKRSKLKRGFTSLLVFLILVGGLGYFGFQRLLPKNHFKSVSTVAGAQSFSQEHGTVNIVLLGSDARAGETVSHSDSILLMHVDFNTNQIKIASIPRDTRVDLPGYGYTKLTSVQFIEESKLGTTAGIKEAVKTIGELTGVPINYYAETSYQGLESMVNVLGTVNIDVPFDVTFTHPWYKKDGGIVIKKGVQNLDGKMVTELVHERDSLPGTDFGRQQVQEKAILGIVKAALKPSNIPHLPSLINQASNFLVATNMSKSDMMSFGLALKNLNPSKQMQYYQLKYTTQNLYDNALQATNSEVVLDPANLQQVMSNFK